MWRESPGLRKFAGKGLEADDERQLHDLCFRKMFPNLREALFGYLEVVTGNPLAELERGPLSLTVVRALSVRQDIGEFLRRDSPSSRQRRDGCELHFHARAYRSDSGMRMTTAPWLRSRSLTHG